VAYTLLRVNEGDEKCNLEKAKTLRSGPPVYSLGMGREGRGDFDLYPHRRHLGKVEIGEDFRERPSDQLLYGNGGKSGLSKKVH